MSLTVLLLLLCALLGAPAQAAPALAPAVQATLDGAVLAYEEGRLAQARAAFEGLLKQGVPAAAYNLAVMHLRGEMPRSSQVEGRRLLERAGRGGFITAQVMLARALENGDFGVRELGPAHRWYALAAEAGSVEAQVAMGTAHYLGRGLPKDAVRAAHWFREGAKGGDVGAMYLLASMYEQGEGVERDLRLARYWYDIAARNGDEAAPFKRRQIDALLASVPG